MADANILMGVVGRPHGVRGLVRVHSYTAEPAELADYAPLIDAKGRAWSLAWRSEGVAELRDADGRPLPDRSAAEKLVNLQLFVPRARLPAPDPEEFYLADLVDMAATDAAGAVLGRVAVVHDYGAGASLEILRADGTSFLVPFTREAVPGVDLPARQLTLNLPAEIEIPGEAAT